MSDTTALSCTRLRLTQEGGLDLSRPQVTPVSPPPIRNDCHQIESLHLEAFLCLYELAPW